MGVAAGSAGTSIILRNASPAACSLRGYPSVQLLGADGRPIQTLLDHGPAMVMPPHLRVRTVTLEPGESARVYVGYANAGDFIGMRGFAGCPLSASLRLTLPGSQAAITLKLGIDGARETGGRVQCGAVSVSPVTREIRGWA